LTRLWIAADRMKLFIHAAESLTVSLSSLHGSQFMSDEPVRGLVPAVKHSRSYAAVQSSSRAPSAAG